MYPKAYIDYLVHFHGDRDYFQCHEILEDYWKKTNYGNKQSIWVGLIQLAVSCYHHRRGNFTGAEQTLEKAVTIFANEESNISKLGLNGFLFTSMITDRLMRIHHQEAYKSFNFPIIDPALTQRCKLDCKRLGLHWCSVSNLNDVNLVNRHKLRDRSNVILQRLDALNNRKGNK